MPLSKEYLLEGLSASFGKEKADEMINGIITQAGLPLKTEYTKEEGYAICDQLDASNERFLKIIGNSLRVQIMLMKD